MTKSNKLSEKKYSKLRKLLHAAKHISIGAVTALTIYATGVGQGILIPDVFIGEDRVISQFVSRKNLGETTAIRRVFVQDNEYTFHIPYERLLTDIATVDTSGDVWANTTSNDPLLEHIVSDVLELPTGNKLYDAQKVLNFVQELPYHPYDGARSRRSAETLLLGGDCQDKSSLLISLYQTKTLNYDVAVLLHNQLPNEDAGHVLVAIHLGEEDNPPANAVKIAVKSNDGAVKYYYDAETTATGHLIGRGSDAKNSFSDGFYFILRDRYFKLTPEHIISGL